MGPPAGHMHLYQLSRGITNAIIHQLQWSLDQRWLCATTARGTSHLWGVHPEGSSLTRTRTLTMILTCKGGL